MTRLNARRRAPVRLGDEPSRRTYRTSSPEVYSELYRGSDVKRQGESSSQSVERRGYAPREKAQQDLGWWI